MIFIGADDRSNKGALIINSWGKTRDSAPKRFKDEPAGCFWADKSAVVRMIDQGDCYSHPPKSSTFRMRYVFSIAIACALAFGPNVQGQVVENGADPNQVAEQAVYDLGVVKASDPDAVVVETAPEGKADTLVVLSAKWCGPCQLIKPTLIALKAQGYNIKIHDIDLRQAATGRQQHQAGQEQAGQGERVERGANFVLHSRGRDHQEKGRLHDSEENQGNPLESRDRKGTSG